MSNYRQHAFFETETEGAPKANWILNLAFSATLATGMIVWMAVVIGGW